ncbi:imm11 family protein [Rhodovulum marinum]|uniref:Immunity MXAN-0049 protein domain-containing protein n=1 Tax=Rhodovulum marinum TaxID=320662 RepID=A0A4V2SPL0_9RHOB|nr:DUF1629 domain-containing protein [Rhodovulum marinum]TCP35416.1 hypothetical protein EV662_1295 [Rhodovulum marinum]
MPYLLTTHTYRPEQIFWEDVWPIAEQPDGYARIGRGHGKPPMVEGPIPYRMYKGHLRDDGLLPDLIAGRWANDLIVSSRVRDLIESKDKVAHSFVPLDLTLEDGSTVSGQFFLFVSGERTDGIVPEASNVVPKYLDGEFRYYTCPGEPEIAWRAKAIEGRRNWVDRYLPGEIFVSDDLAADVAKLGPATYDLKPASVFVE